MNTLRKPLLPVQTASTGSEGQELGVLNMVLAMEWYLRLLVW